MINLNRLICIGIASMHMTTDILIKRIRYISVVSASLILTACASQPGVAPGTAATADGQRANVDVIDAKDLAAFAAARSSLFLAIRSQ